MNPDAITIRFVEAIWDACPWAAPQPYLERKAREKDFIETLFRKAGMNPEPPTP
jgi:hypothetical protein